ncbi:hypothetical protein GCM10010149_88200 [Nonomuraea roseoviolacea subsp. roseoviolacea]|uniref:hypothetical protein n=1 Tax=Nonomuraea roseoviolacea TaxID=103837 RepID=UPI0031DF56D0
MSDPYSDQVRKLIRAAQEKEREQAQQEFSWAPMPPADDLDLSLEQIEEIAYLIYEAGRDTQSAWGAVVRAARLATRRMTSDEFLYQLYFLAELIHAYSCDLVDRPGYDTNRKCSRLLAARLMRLTDQVGERV